MGKAHKVHQHLREIDSGIRMYHLNSHAVKAMKKVVEYNWQQFIMYRKRKELDK